MCDSISVIKDNMLLFEMQTLMENVLFELEGGGKKGRRAGRQEGKS